MCVCVVCVLVVLRGVHGSRGMFACTFAYEDAMQIQITEGMLIYACILIYAMANENCIKSRVQFYCGKQN